MKRHKDGHYEYIANYVDDVISFSKDPMSVIEEIKKDYMLKGVGGPEYYLGSNVDQLDHTWNEDNVSLGLSARTYTKNTVERFEATFGTELRLQKTPMSEQYHPESDEMTPDGKKARITVYVDTDHAHDVVTRQSVTAILLFINNMPIR
jgi:lipopolysaccharide assembly outer membrane protein LptD (OstA)